MSFLNMVPGMIPGANPQGFGSDPMPADYGSESYARRTRAWLARQQWNDYQQRFQPVEQELINAITTPEMLDQRLSAIRANVSNAGNASSQVQDMLMRRYGVAPSAQQRQVDANNRDLAASLASVNAANNTRTQIYDRNQAALAGGSAVRSDIRSSYEGN